MQDRYEFPRINFGQASAQAEARENPDLLIRGYLDFQRFERKISDEPYWLVLGYKGSGKSAIAERMRLLYMNDPTTFVNLINIEDFEYVKFTHIVRDKEAIETTLPTAWAWVMYSFLINSFFKDMSVTVPYQEEYEQIQASFKQMGLSPVYDMQTIIKLSSESSFQLTIPKFAEKKWTKRSESQSVDIRWYVYNLRPFIGTIRSRSRHYIIIDGLDDILTNKSDQYASIGALVFEANRINSFLRENNVPAKVVVLCRTDIFELLGGANRNKIRQDYAIDLDWNSNPKTPDKSLLVDVANLRAELALGRRSNVIRDFFPRKIFGRSTLKYLLDMTRHTPRDFLQLLRFSQASAAEGSLGHGEMKNALREYSNKYFLPEVFDELEGYATAEEMRNIVRAIGYLRSRDFTMEDLVEASGKMGWQPAQNDMLRIMNALYECSAIGNVRLASRKKGLWFLSYKYRNRHSAFKHDERIMLHRGLWRAFNLEMDPFPQNIDPDLCVDV